MSSVLCACVQEKETISDPSPHLKRPRTHTDVRKPLAQSSPSVGEMKFKGSFVNENMCLCLPSVPSVHVRVSAGVCVASSTSSGSRSAKKNEREALG